jgi:hypothetical protein
MSTDYFGRTLANYDTTAKIASAEYLAINIGSGAKALTMVQDLNMQFRREFSPVTGVGTAGIHFVSGHGQGSLSVSRALNRVDGSANKMLDGFKGSGNNCGITGTITVSGTDAGQCELAPGGNFRAPSAHLMEVNLRASAGDMKVVDGASWLLPTLES